MDKRPVLVAVAVMAALLPAPAGAEGPPPLAVGWRCTADATVPDQTLLATGQVGTSTLPIVPTGVSSVITSWGVQVGAGLGPMAQRLEVFAAPNGAGERRKVGESESEVVSALEPNLFETRIPVQGGESIGLFGPEGTLACAGEEGAVSFRSSGGGEIGETRVFATESGVGTPVTARVEHDYDEDGYGDETQDRCEGEGSRGGDCPIGVSIAGVAVNRRAIVLEVTPAAWARIEVRGEFRWRETPTRPGEPGRRAGTDRTVTKWVNEGRTGVFRVSLPGQVLRRLERRPRDSSMVARLEVFVTDRHGWESERSRRVMLPGRR